MTNKVTGSPTKSESYNSSGSLSPNKTSKFSSIVHANLYESLYKASNKVLPTFSGNLQHIKLVNDFVFGGVDFYKEKYKIDLFVCRNASNELNDFLQKEICAVLHYEGPHFTLILKLQNKVIVFSKSLEKFSHLFQGNDSLKLYSLDPEIFKKPKNEPAQDEEVIAYQADDVSCGFFALKQAKELLVNDGELLKQTIFLEENAFAYPHPSAFKHSQSNIFLQYYVQRYSSQVEAHTDVSNPILYTNEKLEESINQIQNYRDLKFGKARIFYYNMKYLQPVQDAYLNFTSKNSL